jgi:hypothetical protein
MRKYSNPFPCQHEMANTLSPSDLGFHSENGWTVTGAIHDDWVQWVNDFEASHPDLGEVKGNFEADTLQASSKKALDDFCKHFQPSTWDYWDI